MVQNNKNKNISHKAFTLIEMVIVLIIMWIMLLFTTSLSGDQIQKVKNKAVKESILSEMQTRYSRNLWSSSFAWKMYDVMYVKLSKWENKIDFIYDVKDGEDIENTFMDHFEIKYITLDSENINPKEEDNLLIKYHPYKISCEIWDDEKNKNLLMIARINDNKNYCFEIRQKNCRLTEIPEKTCDTLKELVKLDD